MGHHINELVLPGDDPQTDDALVDTIEGGTISIVNRFRRKNGSIRTISWTAVPAGELTYVTGRDITDERLRAAALEKAQEALRQSRKMEVRRGEPSRTGTTFHLYLPEADTAPCQTDDGSEQS